MALPRGFQVRCPVDGAVLYETTQDIAAGERLMASHFRGVGEIPDPTPGIPFECPEHGADLTPSLRT